MSDVGYLVVGGNALPIRDVYFTDGVMVVQAVMPVSEPSLANLSPTDYVILGRDGAEVYRSTGLGGGPPEYVQLNAGDGLEFTVRANLIRLDPAQRA
jgi:hypothetical protein